MAKKPPKPFVKKDTRLPRPVYEPGSLEHMMSEANKNAGLHFDPIKPEPRRSREHRLLAKAKLLGPEELLLLQTLVAGEAALVVAKGVTYAIRPSELGYVVRTLKPGAEEYIVTDGGCTCPDSHFRGGRCKHMEVIANVSLNKSTG